MNDYYVGLTGAKKNVGDFLITQRSLALLRHFRPDRDIVVYPHWESLESKLDTVNKSKAIIVLGGPGFQQNMYPNTYKLTKNLERITVPIIPMGLGSKSFPGDSFSLNSFQFSKTSRRLLDKIALHAFPISCRDYPTQDILYRNGIRKTLMTGCPVWYDLDSIGKAIEAPFPINRIVITPAQKEIYRSQTVDLLNVVRGTFPDSTLYCSFHRGISSTDQFTPKSDAANNTVIAREAEKRNYQVIDASFSINNIDFYDTCDLHIGYRVHGHLCFLSKRKPSFLLHEDGRGVGLSYSLGLYGIDAFKRTVYGYVTKTTKPNLPLRILNRFVDGVVSDDFAVQKLSRYINEERENGFIRYSCLHETIDRHFEIMKRFIKQLP